MEKYFRVRIGNIKLEQVRVRTGLRQEDSLLPILFNITLEKVIRKMNMGQHEGVNLQGHTIGLLAYADDLVLITESQNELKLLFRRLEKSLAKISLRINKEKTKYMSVKRKSNARLNPSLRIDQYNFGRVEQFKIRKNEELESLYQKPNIVESIRTKKLQWAGHAWRNKNPLIRTVLEKNPKGKRPIEKTKNKKGECSEKGHRRTRKRK
ncbi:hypothetical protein AGLY_008353 [Aphis glycines]|uniref:Reverse transcriptase domain-containing protein n=1 Tax=Aphis glycines TaxID=307491 RepID=A0A6G0TM21_APHGL|nr:hypothetical protein AGLY_008353 [Aphis glycines]